MSPLRARYPEHLHGPIVHSGHPGTRLIPELRAEYQVGAGPGMTWPCRSPWTFARILASGDVELCFKYPIGNLRDRSFMDIWTGPEAMAVRRMVAENTTICPACEHYRFCLKGGSLDATKEQNQASSHLILFERVGEYNLIAWQKRLYALHRSLGRIEVDRYDVRGLPGVFTAATSDALRTEARARQHRPTWQRQIDRATARVAGELLRRSPRLQHWLRHPN
jgi:radical SAM protein with 4Fe4S-binding SPASM domain